MARIGVAPATWARQRSPWNILVASIGSVRSHLAGHVRWPSLVPFLIGPIPLAFVRGAIVLGMALYKPIAGLVLLVAALQLFRTAGRVTESDARATRIPLVPAVVSGAGISLLSGLTGTGGGIFLTPLILFACWSEARVAAGISAAFISPLNDEL